MEKVSIPVTNSFCPQAMFLYGTYKEDGMPNFGTFVWFSYCWDVELHVMACIGGDKLTKDRIHANTVFSANLVTKSMIPLADYLGYTEGYTASKMNIPIEIERGVVLPVPVVKSSPWVYELKVKQTIELNGSEVHICKIHNVLVDKELNDENMSVSERMNHITPAIYTGANSYFTMNTDSIGTCGDWKDSFNKVDY